MVWYGLVANGLVGSCRGKQDARGRQWATGATLESRSGACGLLRPAGRPWGLPGACGGCEAAADPPGGP